MVYNDRTRHGPGFFRPLPPGTEPVEILEWMARGGHERLIALQDRASGLRAWIALHDLRRGPGYGGIRIWHYRDENEAVLDALLLSRAMTFKCALAELRGGGAKTVVLADRLSDRPAAMERLGQHIEELGGRYRCGPDVGFGEADRRALIRGTRYFAHDVEALRAAGEATAEGGEWAIRAALDHVSGRADLRGARVALQGLGAVGGALARRLVAAGALVTAADPDRAACERARANGVQVVDPTAIFEQDADVFAPCALGGTLHDLTIQRLRAPLVVGCANNVLARPEHAELLRQRGIVFVPDFVVSAGALIEGVGHEQTGRSDFGPELRRIGDTVRKVLRRAEAAGCTPTDAAIEMAREILEREDPAAAACPPHGEAEAEGNAPDA